MTTTATAITAPTISQILALRLLQSTTREASSLPSHLVRVVSPVHEVRVVRGASRVRRHTAAIGSMTR
jgi:hypothetical protein